MGSADVVPGVSGGTMAFILGIYEELIESIRMAGRPEFFRALGSFQISTALRLVNFPFLATLLAGILIAVITLAPGIEWTLENQPVLIWSFFFGLVLASAITVGRKIKHWRATTWSALIAGTVGAFLLVGLVPVETPNTWWFLFLSGALAICAMILPGISGSFILVLLGKYQYVLSAVNDRDFVTLFWVALGAVIGLVTFAQLLSWLFKRYHDVTVALLIGFMLGSLRKVWPWKEVVASIPDSEGHSIPTVIHNTVPPLTVNGALNMEIVWAVALAILGLVLVVALERLANRKDEAGTA
jgi:putative membrane protein